MNDNLIILTQGNLKNDNSYSKYYYNNFLYTHNLYLILDKISFNKNIVNILTNNKEIELCCYNLQRPDGDDDRNISSLKMGENIEYKRLALFNINNLTKDSKGNYIYIPTNKYSKIKKLYPAMDYQGDKHCYTQELNFYFRYSNTNKYKDKNTQLVTDIDINNGDINKYTESWTAGPNLNINCEFKAIIQLTEEK